MKESAAKLDQFHAIGQQPNNRNYKVTSNSAFVDLSRATFFGNAWKIRKLNGGQGRSRTADTRIFSPLLYRLSYLAIRVKAEILRKSSGESRIRRIPREFFGSLFDEVDHLTFQAHAVERVDFLNSRWAGHIDFGEKVSDHIQADEIQSLRSQ